MSKSLKKDNFDGVWMGRYWDYSLEVAGDLKDTDSERKDNEKKNGEIMVERCHVSYYDSIFRVGITGLLT